MENSNSRRIGRPAPIKLFSPAYYEHKPYEDNLAILVCQIKIWEPIGTDWFNIPKADTKGCLTIRECESIEITDSAKELIGKAVVKFPRGTIISLSSKQGKTVKTGTEINGTELNVDLKTATNDGDLITTESARFADDGTSVTSMAPHLAERGMVDYIKSKKESALLSPNDVAIGNRIEIRLGYAYSESEFQKMNSADSDSNLDMVFTGFITSVSVDTPLEIECMNMAYVLGTISTPNIPEFKTLKAKDFLDDTGLYHLLQGTGIELVDWCKGSDIDVNGRAITHNLTVADVLSEWSKAGVLCMMDNKNDGSSRLKVGLAYYAGAGGQTLSCTNRNYITYNGGNKSIRLIQFDWDVAQDKLGLMHNDKRYLAVEAIGRTKDNQFFKLTVRKNPDPAAEDDWELETTDDFQIVNRKKLKDRKKSKSKKGTKGGSPKQKPTKIVESKMIDKVKMKDYTVIPYFSTKVGVTENELIEEAKQYWAKFVPNGISGSIEIFGDFLVRPTDIVALIDMRQPEKNGYYYVESVNTTFGLGGYRMELKLPIKVADFGGPVTIIE